MCGIAGYLALSNAIDASVQPTVLGQMGAALRHRGPDDCGIWTDSHAGIGLVHRRLSIVDLSPAGHQPMISACGRFVIVFNGEIYNHLELRKELAAPNEWRGHSDTEVLLASISAWGVEAALRRCIGMFAFALWDKLNRTLTLARDRMGEKPLYYGKSGDFFLFGSELKSLRAHPTFRADINRQALSQFFRYGYVPAPLSIYMGVQKLLPGTVLTVSRDHQNANPVTYWSVCSAVRRGRAARHQMSDVEAVDEFERLARHSVRQQSLADVPLGAFLSGGVDSSTVVALMQSQASRRVKTFSIGFHESGFDEAKYATAVAQHLGTTHTNLYVSPEEALAVIPQLPTIFDEPFSDVSQIPTALIARMARQHVTVALTGDGGDELFGGYNRYTTALQLWRCARHLPGYLQRGMSHALHAIPATVWDHAGQFLGMAELSEKARKISRIVGAQDLHTMYDRLVSNGSDSIQLAAGTDPYKSLPRNWADHLNELEPEQQMMYTDTVTYLPDDILTKVDRASMAHSLETRVPLLDHRIVEFAWELPLHMKIRNGRGKWLVRQVLLRHVPESLVNRPKAGFGVPIGEWLRGPLREWACSVLDEKQMQSDGLLCVERIRNCWSEHLSGRHNWQNQLWKVLMFQAWFHDSDGSTTMGGDD